MKTRFSTPALALAGVTTLALGACSTDGDAEGAANGPAADNMTITDTWAIAAEEGMTSAYGELTNDSESDLVIASASSPAAEAIELHETVENEAGEMVMREIEGGFVIPAAGSLTLEPGGDHLMLMGLTSPLLAGEEVDFVLEFDDGSTAEFTASIRDFAGGNENYESHDDHDDH